MPTKISETTFTYIVSTVLFYDVVFNKISLVAWKGKVQNPDNFFGFAPN